MNFCKCGCGLLVQNNFKRGHGRRGKKNSVAHNCAIKLANTGKKRTEEQIQKFRERFLGFKHSQETKVKMSSIAQKKGFGKWMKGRQVPESTRMKISNANTGRLVTPCTREKISKANRGENNGMFGKTHTNEVRKKIAESSISMWKDPETRVRLIASLNTPEYKEFRRQSRSNIVLPVKDTTIEIIVKDFLVMLNIAYEQHKVIRDIEHWYQCDFYIPKENLVIECDGDYWHNYPDGRDIDHLRTKEMTLRGYKVLRLWERFIRKLTLQDFEVVLSRVLQNDFDNESCYFVMRNQERNGNQNETS